jgi:starvation-inducible DNA-binding protein
MSSNKSEIQSRVIQPYGSVISLPLGITDNVRAQSIVALNQVLADTMILRDMYKKHHWQVSGATFYQLHLLLDKHHGEQAELVDSIAERVQTLGGVSLAMGADVAEETQIARPPRGREDVPTQLSRLLDAHEKILTYSRRAAAGASAMGDEGTNDLLISGVVRIGEAQVWFLAEHLAATANQATNLKLIGPMSAAET